MSSVVNTLSTSQLMANITKKSSPHRVISALLKKYKYIRYPNARSNRQFYSNKLLQESEFVFQETVLEEEEDENVDEEELEEEEEDEVKDAFSDFVKSKTFEEGFVFEKEDYTDELRPSESDTAFDRFLNSNEDAQWNIYTDTPDAVKSDDYYDFTPSEDNEAVGGSAAMIDDEDSESHLMALMQASSTISTRQQQLLHSSMDQISDVTVGQGRRENKKSLMTRHSASTRKMLIAEASGQNEKRSSKYDTAQVNHFMTHAKDVLSKEAFLEFLTLLAGFANKKCDAEELKELYSKASELLNKYSANELLNEMDLLLNGQQALLLSRTLEHLVWQRIKRFCDLLLTHFSSEMHTLNKLMRTLKQIKQNEPAVDKRRLKSLLSRYLAGHPFLMNEFNALFLDERPNENFLRQYDQFDEVRLGEVKHREDGQPAHSFVEELDLGVSALEQQFGTHLCPCNKCHKLGKGDEQSNEINNGEVLTHCISCGIRFLGGKIYSIQKNRKLQIVQIQSTPREQPANT